MRISGETTIEMNTVIVNCYRCGLGCERFPRDSAPAKYECNSCSHVDYTECSSCGVTAAVFKLRGEKSMSERPEIMLYKCQHCGVRKCSKCIGNMTHWNKSRNTVSTDGWLEFCTRRWLSLHSCSQKCHDSYEEKD